MPGKVKLLVLDLDRVLWDHHDATSLELPLKRIDERTLVDAKGEVVTLRDNVPDFLFKVKKRGILLSTCSWNDYNKAVSVLEAFSLEKYFDLLMIEPHPEKHNMMEKILEHFKKLQPDLSEEDVLFVDDNEEMLEKVKRRFPNMRVLRFHPEGDIFSFSELEGIVLGD